MSEHIPSYIRLTTYTGLSGQARQCKVQVITVSPRSHMPHAMDNPINARRTTRSTARPETGATSRPRSLATSTLSIHVPKRNSRGAHAIHTGILTRRVLTCGVRAGSQAGSPRLSGTSRSRRVRHSTIVTLGCYTPPPGHAQQASVAGRPSVPGA